MPMSDLKQRFLLQELAKIGFRDAYYLPESDHIKVQPGNTRMPYINGDGNISYGAENNDFVRNTIRPLVLKVDEIVGAWEKAQPMPFEGVSNFRLLAEYNNVIFAARDDIEKGYGFHFVTWKCNYTRTGVEQGHYTQDYEWAKQDFATRSGMIPKEKIFTAEQAAEMITAIEYRFNNDDNITLKTEDMLDEISAKLKTAYPETASILEKAAPEKGIPVIENTATPEQAKGLYQQLTDKIDAEMESYTDYIMAMDKREMFGMATDIAMREEIVWSLKNNEYEFDDDALEYLLSYDGLLTGLSNELKRYVLDGISTNGDVKDTIINVLSQRFESSDYSLNNDGITGDGNTGANVKPDKYSILGDLKEKSKEIKPPEKQQKKDDIDLS